MPTAFRAPGAIAMAFLVLFLGGAVIGLGLAGALAPGSWPAQIVSFFALPVAFAAGLQAWYGLALLSVIPRMLSRIRGREPVRQPSTEVPQPSLPGAFVFLPIASGAGAGAGLVVGLLSPIQPVWLVFLVYWLVGTTHGMLAWRLARAGFLLPPEST